MRTSPSDGGSLGRTEQLFSAYFGLAGLRQPDEVEHVRSRNELRFAWRTERTTLVVKLGPRGPIDLHLEDA